MNWLMQVFVGEKPARKILLDLSEIIIGRSSACHIQIPHMIVSKKHARLAIMSKHVLVEDLGSTNGVYVMGDRITRHMLNSGDRFTIGPYTFFVEQVSFPVNAQSVAELNSREVSNEQSTIFIDEEMRKKFAEKSNPLEETRLVDEEDMK